MLSFHRLTPTTIICSLKLIIKKYYDKDKVRVHVPYKYIATLGTCSCESDEGAFSACNDLALRCSSSIVGKISCIIL